MTDAASQHDSARLDYRDLILAHLHNLNNRLGALRMIIHNSQENWSRSNDHLGENLNLVLGLVENALDTTDKIGDLILATDFADFPQELLKGKVGYISIARTIVDGARAAVISYDTSHIDMGLNIQIFEAVEAEPLLLSEIFRNLVDNALRALQSSRGGRLEIVARLEGASVIVDVKDNGPGIRGTGIYGDTIDELDSLLFEPTEDRPGWGLPLGRRILRRWGGDLQLVLSTDKETVFRVTLPAPGRRPTFTSD